jgi:hypothetical protein
VVLSSHSQSGTTHYCIRKFCHII